jgi:hypothetical protein
MNTQITLVSDDALDAATGGIIHDPGQNSTIHYQPLHSGGGKGDLDETLAVQAAMVVGGAIVGIAFG